MQTPPPTPTALESEIRTYRHAHTTLWQEAAVHALAALVASGTARSGWTTDELASRAFNLADALLMERARLLHAPLA